MAKEFDNEFDVLVVGAGFSGLQMLNKLRKKGFNVKIFEAANDLGGTWHYNCYPGARADSGIPVYQLTHVKELWGFEWTERFPGRDEICEYFRFFDRNLNLSKDIQYNTRVNSADFDESRNQWIVESSKDGAITVTAVSHLILCTGVLSCKYTPDIKGLEKFKGEWYHTSAWPQDKSVDLKGKRVAVVGTGSTGVQLIQEIGPIVGHLTVYQRTPNIALPMQQSSIKDQSKWRFPQKDDYEKIFENTLTTFGAMEMDFVKVNALDVTPEERRAFYENLFQLGGFHFWVGTYQDILYSKEANDTAYEFWCEKTRARIHDPVKREILAPKIPPHALGTKRPCLEQYYYEVCNQTNVDIINVRESPILEVTENGIKTEKEGLVHLDFIIFATGFNGSSGSILDIQIKNAKGESLQEKWKNGIRTHLGLATSGFPNFFFIGGPQGPAALINGPSLSEIQGDWLVEIMVKIRSEQRTRVEATKAAEEKWRQEVIDVWNAGLLPGTDSWYQGANIPGKIREPECYAGGCPAYIAALSDCAVNNYEGFDFA